MCLLSLSLHEGKSYIIDGHLFIFFFTDISVLPACRTVLKHSKHTVGMFWMNRWMNEYMLLCASTKPSNEEKLDPILNKQIVLWEGLG